MNRFEMPDGTTIDLCDDCEEQVEMDGIELIRLEKLPDGVCAVCDSH